MSGPVDTEGTKPSDELPGVTLGHFAVYRYADRFWDLDRDQRRTRARQWFSTLCASADAAQLYLLQGVETGSDLLLWSTVRLPTPSAVGAFFGRRASAENAHRSVIQPGHVLWGVTRPSQYSKARSTQEIDPLAPGRSPYLVMYPFSKTADWYLLGRDTRQGMMNEHIRIGKQYRDIRQLLLYSFGLQDQEFVVVYETDDLGVFSRLVYELRDTEARRFTKADTPLHTGIRLDPDRWMEML